MRDNHLLATSTFLKPKTQDQKLKSLVWWGKGHGGHKT
jgi:hypothetical protein